MQNEIISGLIMWHACFGRLGNSTNKTIYKLNVIYREENMKHQKPTYIAILLFLTFSYQVIICYMWK